VRLTVRRKIIVGLMVTLGIGAVSMLIVYDGLRTLQRSVHRLAQVEEPTVIAAYEMEINVLGIATALLRYLDARDPDDLWRVRKDQSDYRRFYDEYVRLSKTDDARRLARRLDDLFRDFNALGEQMMARRDRESALFARVTQDIERIDAIIDTHLQTRRPQESVAELSALQESFNLEADIAEVGFWLANYRRTHRPAHLDLLRKNTDECRQAYVRLHANVTLTSEKRRWVNEIGRLFERTIATVGEVVVIERQLIDDGRRFVTLRNDIDDLLDDRIQVLALEDLQRPRQQADRDATAIVDRTRALLVLFMVAGAAVGWVFISSMTRPMARLVRGTDAVRRGDFDHRIAVRGSDEFADLAGRFNAMVEQLQATTVSKALLEESDAQLRSANEELRHEMAERQRAEEAEGRMRVALQRSQMLAAMGSLVAGVAHEVRNPLFGIASTVDALDLRLRQLPTGTEYVRHIEVLRTEVERMSRLMQDLLEYGKPSALERAPISLREVADAAVAVCARRAASAQVTLETDVPGDLPPVLADRARLAQVFQNLLDNAIQHGPAGSVVWVAARRTPDPEGTWLECRVTDAGPGFKPDDLPHVFEPFFTRRRKGTGLGLSIVERIVDEHGGTIEAGNRPEGGAVVIVRLPAAGTMAAVEKGVGVAEDSDRR